MQQPILGVSGPTTGPIPGPAAVGPVARMQSSSSYDDLIRSLEVSIEQAFAGLASAFLISPLFSLQNERERILRMVDTLANLLRDQGDAVLTLPDTATDEDCKEAIADLRRQINQITGSNSKIAAQVLNKLNAVQRLKTSK